MHYPSDNYMDGTLEHGSQYASGPEADELPEQDGKVKLQMCGCIAAQK